MDNQEQKLNKKIVEKIDELRSWSLKVEKIQKDFKEIDEKKIITQKEYNDLQKDIQLYSESIEKQKKVLSNDIEKLNSNKDEIENKIVTANRLYELTTEDLKKRIDKSKEETEKSELRAKEVKENLDSLNRQKDELQANIEVLTKQKIDINNFVKDLKNACKEQLQKLSLLKKQIEDIQKREKAVSIREERLKRLNNK